MKFLLIAFLSLQMVSKNTFKDSKFIIFDFSKDSNIKNWRIVNDDVMGGISSSTFTLSKDGHGVFKGIVSTDNNGGFASVRYAMNKTKVENLNSITIRLKGDGKNYQFRIKHKNSDYFSYITSFSTSGEWELIEIKLADLYPSFRGRKLDKPNFNKNDMEQISFLIANNKNERFQLEIDRIELNK